MSTDRSAPCPKCRRLFCPGHLGEGRCIRDMRFCGEPTADFDEAGAALRAWYEAHRETWWQRRSRLGRMARGGAIADEFMLGMLNEVHRIDAERRRQLADQANHHGIT